MAVPNRPSADAHRLAKGFATVTQVDGMGWHRAARLWRTTDGSRVAQVQRTFVPKKASEIRTRRGFQGERPDEIGHQLQVSNAAHTACLNGKRCTRLNDDAYSTLLRKSGVTLSPPDHRREQIRVDHGTAGSD